jgi:hypothetical protein
LQGRNKKPSRHIAIADLLTVGIPAVAAVPAPVYVRVVIMLSLLLVLTLRLPMFFFLLAPCMESLSGAPAVADVHVVVAWLTFCF